MVTATRNWSKPIATRAPTKVPAKTAFADDLVIVEDGVEYWPHAGETVTYRPKNGTLADYLYEVKARALQFEIGQAIAAGTLEFSQSEELASLLREGREKLAARLISWTWTDPEGQPYPSPPTEDVLNTLSAEEINWLQRLVSGGSEADSKNEDGDSTST